MSAPHESGGIEADGKQLLRALGSGDELRVNNHWVPVVYLSAFTDRQTALGGFYLYNREELDRTPGKVPPKAVAKERGLYLTEYADGKPRDLLERFFARYIEAPYGLIRNKLAFGPRVGLAPSLNEFEQDQLANFIAIQQGRTPEYRDQVEWFASFGHTLHLRARMQDLGAFREEHRERTGEDVSMATLRRWRAELDTGKLSIRPGGPQEWMRTFLTGSLRVAECILSLPWRLCRPPAEVHFPASDTPVVLARRQPGSLSYRLGAGWLQPDSEATFALSSDCVLAIGPNVETDSLLDTPGWHRSVRERTILHSRRFVFDREQDPAIPQLMRDTPPYRPVVEYGGEEFTFAQPIGPIVKRVVEGSDDLIRFGHARRR